MYSMADPEHELDPEEQLPVVGIEPSEIYTLQDEFLDLLPARRQEIEALSKRTWLLEELLIRPQKIDKEDELRVTMMSHRSSLSERPKIVLHGHCYQKARPPADDGYPIGQNASAELLRLLDYEVEIIPSGCCGMAGAFGYEAEHYNVSMQVGELTLFPTVRQARQNGELVSAVGTSCRSQIADGTNVQAQHPIVLVANRLQ